MSDVHDETRENFFIFYAITILGLLIAALFVNCETQKQQPLLPDYKFFRVSNVDYDGTQHHYGIISNRDARVLQQYIDCDQDSIRVSDLGDTTLLWIDDRVHNAQVTVGETTYRPDSCGSTGERSINFCVWAIPTDSLLKYGNIFETKNNDYQYDAAIFDCDPLPVTIISFTYVKEGDDYIFYVEVADEVNADMLYVEGSNDAVEWTTIAETKLDNKRFYTLTYDR